MLTQVRWQRTFRWYNLYSLNFRRPNKTDNPFLAFWNNHWLLIGDIAWFHTNHKCQLRCISPTLLHILISRFSHHSLRQTKQHFLSCWLRSFVWVEAAAGFRYSIATVHTEQLKSNSTIWWYTTMMLVVFIEWDKDVLNWFNLFLT